MAEQTEYSGADLLKFLKQDMVMSSHYQPLIVKELVLAGGILSADELAKKLLLADRFEVERARAILMRWPYRTLKKRAIIAYDRSTREFRLPVRFESDDQRSAVLAACQEDLAKWQRKQKPAARLASIAYRIFESAAGRCQACGAAARFGQLDIDHIVPRARADRANRVKLDGVDMDIDDERNLQVLCPRCNRGKRDASSHDFKPHRDWLADSIANTLRLALDQELCAEDVWKLGKERFDARPGMPPEATYVGAPIKPPIDVVSPTAPTSGGQGASVAAPSIDETTPT